MKRTSLAILGVVLGLAILAGAQTKAPAKFPDFGQWESLAPAGARGGFSPDGKWLAYAINRSNRENEIRVAKLSDGSTKAFAFGAQPVFSADSKWLAYAVVPSEAEQEKLRAEQKPVQNKLAVLNLAAGATATVEGVESFAFSPDGSYLAIKRYAPVRPAAPAAGGGAARSERSAAGESPEEAPGTTLLVRRLADGRDTAFGNVSQFAWQDTERNHLLAMIISAEGKTGNGVQLLDAETGVLRALDSSPAVYTDIAWRKDAADLAVLRAKTDDRKDGPTQAVLAWTDLGKAERLRIYDPAADKAFPAGMRTVPYRRLSWSFDGKTIFLGLAKWDDKIVPAEPAKKGAGAAPAEEFAALQIWHWADVVVQPKQKVDAASDRRRSLLAAWHLESGKLVPLGKDAVDEDVVPIRRTNWAYVAEWSKYAMNRTIGRPGADLYLADITTGARVKLRDNVIDGYIQAGPAGKSLLFLKDDQYFTVNLATRAVTNITKAAPVSFIDKESDQTTAQKPPFGVAGWAKDDSAVLLNDKFDVWKIAADGSKLERLTSGTADEVRHRLVRLDYAGGRRFGGDLGSSAPDPGIDLAKPLYFSLYGEWTKKSGFARLQPAGAEARLVWLDKGVGSLAKAKDAEVYGYVVQDFDDSPDIFVGGPDLQGAKPVTATNPFQSKFAWGRSELIEYKGDQGLRLQGALFYPAGYEAGKTYPLIVYMYEKLSQGLHGYVAPSDRSYYSISVFSSLGYFVFEPDIVFTPRQPGVSVVQCVVPGVKKVLERGLVDPKRVGCVGHSWGGFDAAFLASNTQGVFAAAVAGAPLTDLVSMYGDHHWGPGIAETDHIETGQERMEVPLYEDLPDYVKNSAIFTVPAMTVPLLLEEGDADSVVFWHQSVEMYNIARRAGKNVVFLVYEGEDHGLRQKKNQLDYQRRILAWFGHYLKGEPAEPWISGGQSFLDREAEIKRAAPKK